jgi:DNA-binding beta-propeller fold protein YncE
VNAAGTQLAVTDSANNDAFVANERSDNVTVVDPPAGRHHERYRVARAGARARDEVSPTPLVAPLPGETSLAWRVG